MRKEPEAYFITLIHTMGFLKEEMARFYSHWHFKSGAHGFVTYTLDKEHQPEAFRELPTVFALSKGILIMRGSLAECEAKLPELEKKYNAITVHRWDLISEEGDMGDRKNRGHVIDFVRVDQEEFALGVRFQIRGDFAPYNGVSPIPREERAPSNAYQKLGEAFKHFRPLVAHDDVFLDIGCSPGGSTYYLLKKGYRVIGVDPQQVDAKIREDFSEGFLQLKQKYDDLKSKHLKGFPPVNWVVFDVDTNSLEALESLLKLVSKLDECNGIIMTIKMDKGFQMSELDEIDRLALNYDFVEVRKGLLPSHEKEFCLVLTKTE